MRLSEAKCHTANHTYIYFIFFIATQGQQYERKHVDSFAVQNLIVPSSFKAAVPVTPRISYTFALQPAASRNLLHAGDTSASSNYILVFRKDLHLGDGSEVVVLGWFNEIHSSMTDLNQCRKRQFHHHTLLGGHLLRRHLQRRWPRSGTRPVGCSSCPHPCGTPLPDDPSGGSTLRVLAGQRRCHQSTLRKLAHTLSYSTTACKQHPRAPTLGSWCAKYVRSSGRGAENKGRKIGADGGIS